MAICNGLSSLTADPVPFPEAVFGEGTVPILFDDIQCTGEEDSLLECTYDFTTADCSHSDDAGVACLDQGEQSFVDDNASCLHSKHPPGSCG